MRGTFQLWRKRVVRMNWNRRRLRSRGFRPDWRMAYSRDKNLILHRLVWVSRGERI